MTALDGYQTEIILDIRTRIELESQGKQKSSKDGRLIRRGWASRSTILVLPDG